MFISLILSLLLSFSAYADNVLMPEEVGHYTVSTSLEEDQDYIGDEDDEEYFLDPEEEEEFYHASPSEYSKRNQAYNTGFTESLADYFLKLENDPQDIETAEEEDVIMLDPMSDINSSPVLLAPLSALSGYDDDYKNTVVLTGRFNGSTCRLVVPYSAWQGLTMVNGVLLNISNTAITGRLLYGSEEITPSGYTTYNYILNPVYGSTANVWRYGSFNYQRRYYLYTNPTTGSQSIQYIDTYGAFYVDDVKIHYSSSERSYYALMILFVVGVLILCLKRS